MLNTPARRLTPRKTPPEQSPQSAALPPAAMSSSAAALPHSTHGANDAMAARRVLALVAGVATVWVLLASAAFNAGPLFLMRPPITRRSSGFHEFKGSDCSYYLAQGSWTDAFQSVSCTEATRTQYATCAATPQRHWRFGDVAQSCGAWRMAPAEARALLAGKRLVFAGDSIARNLYGAVLRLLGEPGQGIVVGHADFKHSLEGGIALEFYWAPYPSNLTALLGQPTLLGSQQAQQYQAQRQRKPALAGAGSGEPEGGVQAGAEEAEEAAAAQAAEQLVKELQQQQQEQQQQGQEEQQEEQQQPEQQEEQQEQQQEQVEQKQQQEPEQQKEQPEQQVQSQQPEQPEQQHSEQQPEQSQHSEQRQQQPGEAEGATEAATRRRHLLQRRRLREEDDQADEAEGDGQPAAAGAPPALAVFSTTLWHLLHFTDAADFEQQLKEVEAAAASYASAAAQGGHGPRLVLASGTETFPNRMRTQQKQRNMTPVNVDAYNQALEQAGLLSPQGPFSLLDLFPLTRSCGEECSTDGVHSQPVVYDAALQLLLNIAAAGEEAAAQPAQRRAQLRRSLRARP